MQLASDIDTYGIRDMDVCIFDESNEITFDNIMLDSCCSNCTIEIDRDINDRKTSTFLNWIKSKIKKV